VLPIRYKILQVTVLRYFMHYGMISDKLGYVTHLRYLPTGNELQYMYLQYYLPVKTTIRALTVPTYFGLRYLNLLLGNTYGITPTEINNFTKIPNTNCV
jgi:hypothetical protein